MILALVFSAIENNIRRGWDTNRYFSAYSCRKGPISSLPTFVFLKNGQRFENCCLRSSGTLISHLLHQTMRLILFRPKTGAGAMDACMGLILSSVPLPTDQSCRVSIIHIPTFRQQCNLSP